MRNLKKKNPDRFVGVKAGRVGKRKPGESDLEDSPAEEEEEAAEEEAAAAAEGGEQAEEKGAAAAGAAAEGKEDKKKEPAAAAPAAAAASDEEPASSQEQVESPVKDSEAKAAKPAAEPSRLSKALGAISKAIFPSS